VRVTNIQNNLEVIVTINNRILATSSRIIDISKAAADNLKMNPRGTTPVRIEVLSRRKPPAPPPEPEPKPVETPAPAPQPDPPVSQPPQGGITQTFMGLPYPGTWDTRPVPEPPLPVPVEVAPSENLGVWILPNMPAPNSPGLYVVQVGAFLIRQNATDAYRRVDAAGLRPSYEQYGEYTRVLISGARAADLAGIISRIASAKFKEIIIRRIR
jgi:hypothetical protein